MADTRRESEDMNVRGVIVSWLTIVGMVVVSILIAFGFIALLAEHRTTDTFVATRRFPTPRLESDPPRDLAEYRREQQAKVAGYRWIDRNAGVVHIPIRRAMEVLAGHHAPAADRSPPDRSRSASDRKGGCAATPGDIQRGVGVAPRLGKTVPGSLSFRDEQGRPVSFLEVLHNR